MRTAKTHRKFAIYSTFLDTILEGEEEVMEGETRKEVLKRINKELEDTAADLRKEAESMRGQIITETIKGAQESIHDIRQMPLPPIEINLQHERLEIEIDNCKTEEDLKQWKEKNQVIPVPILKYYNNRLKQLMNGTKEV